MDLIGQIASKLGVPQQQAEGIAGTLLGALRKEAPSDVAADMDRHVPEAQDWMQRSGTAESTGGGGLGGMLGGLLGGGGGGAAQLLGALQRFGVDAGSAGKVVPLVVSFLRERLGNESVEKLLAKVPFLGQLGGGGASGGGGLGGLGGLFGR